jgi:hypothetical protein
MKEHAAISEIKLWPGFGPEHIPVAIYDSLRAWLFLNPASNQDATFTFRMLRFACCVSHVAKSGKIIYL